jgi:hypothetical protein
MSTHVRASLITLALVSAGSAGANSLGSGGVIIVRPPPIYICQNATLAYCQTESNANDASCWASNRDACKQLLSGALNQYQASLGKSTAVLPATMSNGGRLYTDMPRDAYDISKAKAILSDNTYASRNAFAQRWELLTYPGDTTPLHNDWETNNSVNSCLEYAYERYYDYSRFEDVTATCRNDYSCIYDVAMKTGVGGLNHQPLARKDGKPMEVQIHPGVLLPRTKIKNDFYRVGLTTFGDVLRYYHPNEAPGILDAAGKVGPYQYIDRWNWHVQAHDAQAPEHLTLPEYSDMAKRQADYGFWIDEFLTHKAALDVAPGGTDTVNKILHPGGVCSPTGCTAPPNLSFPADSEAGKLLLAVNNLRWALVAEWNHRSLKDGVTVDHGCLDPTSARCDWSPRQFADEYAHLFAGEREHVYQRCKRDVIENAQGQFDTVPQTTPLKVYNHLDTDLFDNWLDFAEVQRDQRLKDLPRTLDANGKTAVGSHFPGNGVLGDDDWFGVIYSFDTGYDVELARGNGQPLVCKGQGRIFAKVSAEVDVAKKILGGAMNLKLLDASFTARAGTGADPARGYVDYNVTILGQSFYHQDGTMAADQFHLAPTDDQLRHEVPLINVPFMIGPLPAHVKGDISFTAGLGATASGSAPQDCSSSNFLQLGAQFAPQVTASAHIDAAIGASYAGFGADAGISGDLRLVDVSVPVDVTVGIGTVDLGSGPLAALNLTADGRIQLSALSGSVSAFGQICVGQCFRAEKEIFSWPGITLAKPELFHLPLKGFALADLNPMFGSTP